MAIAEEQKVILDSIQFKRGTKEALINNLTSEQLGVLKAGEPAWETDTNQIKIGDGVSNYEDLPYLIDNEIYYVGYYRADLNKFYTDSTYTKELPYNNQKIYIDLNSYEFYRYYGDLIGYKPAISQATDVTPGVMKLYKTHGENEDGTMTQKAITQGVNSIKFAIEKSEVDEDGDGELENILVLDLPWD